MIKGERAELQDFGTCSFHSFLGEDDRSRKLFPIRISSSLLLVWDGLSRSSMC